MIPALIFAVSFLLYMITLAPTLSFFDSGSLISGAYTLGVNHPPGYPIYAMTGKLFTFIPLGNVAFRVNLHSAFFASMTSVMVYYITRAMLGQGENKAEIELPTLNRLGIGMPEIAGIFASLAFMFSYTLWAWAVVSKFYTLNAFMASVMVYLLLKWRRKVSDGENSLRYLYLFAFLAGLAAAVHISQYPLYVAYAIFIILVTVITVARRSPDGGWSLHVPKWLSYRLVILIPVLFLVGHSVNLYLPVRAVRNPLINWGDPDVIGQFIWLYMRRGYPPVGGGRTFDLFLAQLKSFDLVREFGWGGIVLIAGGIIGHLKKDWLNTFLLLLASVGLTTAVIFMGNPPKENVFLLEQFYIPVYVLLSVLIGGAMYEVMRRGLVASAILALAIPFALVGNVPLAYAKNKLFGANEVVENTFIFGREYPQYQYFIIYLVMAALLFVSFSYVFSKKRKPRPALVLLSIGALFILYPARQVETNFHKNDRYVNFIAYDMANAELTFAPLRTVLFTWGDSGAFPMWYLQDVEHKRPDMLLVHTPHLNLEWFLYSIMRTDPVLGDRAVIEKDYGDLRDYNGVNGIRQMLMMPEYMRQPPVMIRKIIQANPDRPYAWDYSSRYSIYSPRGGIQPPWELLPYGIIYMKPEDDYSTENMRIWGFLQTRGLPRPKISLDLDESKAVTIYGFVHLDIGSWYRRTGQENLARREFELAVAYAPELWPQLRRYIMEPQTPQTVPGRKGAMPPGHGQ